MDSLEEQMMLIQACDAKIEQYNVLKNKLIEAYNAEVIRRQELAKQNVEKENKKSKDEEKK